MNLHPIIVHFPIACLVLYSGLEVLTLLKPSRNQKLSLTKQILLFVGIIFARLALQSGEVAQDIIGRSDLVHTHEEWAEKSYGTYMFLTALYILKLTYISYIKQRLPAGSYKMHIEKFLSSRWFSIVVSILAVAGVIMLTVTGALGGAISHGQNVDPVVKFIYDLTVGK